MTIWATDKRRDIVGLKGLERGNALSCEIICFVQVEKIEKLFGGPRDSRVYALVRWLEPHPDSWERDEWRRPVCPGPLHINHCFWRYALTQGSRRSLVRQDGQPTPAFTRYRHLFGRTEADQNLCRQREERAYYGLVTPDSIVGTLNMCPVFLNNSSSPNCQTWLQSVVMF